MKIVFMEGGKEVATVESDLIPPQNGRLQLHSKQWEDGSDGVRKARANRIIYDYTGEKKATTVIVEITSVKPDPEA